MSIPISSFINNPWNFNVMTDAELEILAADIKSGAVIDKIVFRKKGDRYEIIDGEQRIKALKMLGWKELPSDLCDVRDYSDAQVRSYVRSSLTRGSRKDLIREAEVYLEDYQASGLDMKAYAEKIGVEYTRLSRILKRNNMPLPAKAYVQRNDVHSQVLDELLMARPDYVLPFLERAVNEKWTVEDTKLAIKAGVTVTGEPIKNKVGKDRITDVVKLDMVDRSAMSQILGGNISSITKMMSMCRGKGVIFTGRDFELLIKSINNLKTRIDGQRTVYSTKSGEQTRKSSDVSEWISSGSDDERRDKVSRVNAKIQELVK
jgi:ParB-like chromosome segregation protein Spo0J